jgi:hypothetical protein
VGFRLPEQTLTLVFDDGPYEGAEVEARLSVGFGVFRRLGALLRNDDGLTNTERLDAVVALFLSDVLLGWNLEDHAGPIPLTSEGFERVPPALTWGIVDDWMRVIGGDTETPPLAKTSPPSTGDS